MRETNGYGLGVDLGSSSVAAATAGPRGVAVLPLGQAGELVPATVAWNGSLLVGDAAEQHEQHDPHGVVRGGKRRLGDPVPVVLGDSGYRVEFLLARLLDQVVRRAVQLHGRPPYHVVLTHPPSWGPSRREALAEVGRLAGLRSVATISEAEAAAVEYAARRRLGVGEAVAVYDLGGMMFDAAVLRRTVAGFELVGSPEAFVSLGGADLDQAVVDHVNECLDGPLDELDRADPSVAVAMAQLRRDCARAKETLSAEFEAAIPIPAPLAPQDRPHEVTITRAVFEQLVAGPIAATVERLETAVRNAQIDRRAITAVLLVGGSARIPLVATMISERLRLPVDSSGHPQCVVALGASMVASAGPRPSALPVTPEPDPVGTGAPVSPEPTASADPRASSGVPVMVGGPPAAPPAADHGSGGSTGRLMKLMLTVLLLAALALLGFLLGRAVLTLL